MKICKACKKEIDKKATICPYCRTKQISPAVAVITAIIVIIAVIWGISTFANINKSIQNVTSDQLNGSSNTQTTPIAQITPMIMDATALVGEYDKNKLAAQDKYTGKVIQTTAFISNISSDITGSYYLSLNPNNDQYYSGTTIQCYFNDKNELTSLSNGQSITVKGLMQDMSLGIVEMKDCSLVK